MLNAHGWIFDFLKDEKPRKKTNTVVPPCVHGNLCRQYLREGHGILRETCPKCEFYSPKDWNN